MNADNDALDYAIKIIESYEMDIRNAHCGIYSKSIPDLVALGFCQGTIYKDALRIIKQLRERTDDTPPPMHSL